MIGHSLTLSNWYKLVIFLMRFVVNASKIVIRSENSSSDWTDTTDTKNDWRLQLHKVTCYNLHLLWFVGQWSCVHSEVAWNKGNCLKIYVLGGFTELNRSTSSCGSFIFIKCNVEYIFLKDQIICVAEVNFHHSRRLQLGSNDCRTASQMLWQ